MKEGDLVICPSCKGKGHVFDPMILFVVGVGWLDAIFSRNNPESYSRQVCGQCRGTGFIPAERD